MTKTSCILCEVAHGRAPGTIHYEDNDIAVFDNVLNWAPVMILFAPKEHISQNQLWQNKNLFHKISTCCGYGQRYLSRRISSIIELWE